MEETAEQVIQRTGATKGPRVTMDQINGLIVREYYFTALDGVVWTSIGGWPEGQGATDPPEQDVKPLKMLTICVLVLKNGFTVVGHAGVASPENYKIEVGKKVARDKAIEQLWPILGYQLKQELYDSQDREHEND